MNTSTEPTSPDSTTKGVSSRKWHPLLKLGVTTIGLSLFFIIGFMTGRYGETYLRPTPATSQELTQEDLNSLATLYNTIQSHYIESVDKGQLLEGAMSGMVNALDDPYSEFLNLSESELFDETVTGSFQGIGVEIVSKDGDIMVVSPIDDTPAEKAGLRANDVIVSVDGTELKEMSTREVVELIRGEKGTEVNLKIKRDSTTFDVTVERAEIPVVSVKAELDKEDSTVGYIRVSQFAGNTYDQLVEGIDRLKQEGATSFIFDFRANPGGLLDQAMKISNIFLDEGETIFQIEESNSQTETSKASKGLGTFKVTDPYVVLVDEGSASASEIFAGAIQQNTNHSLVGTQTFGKGTVQTIANENAYGELKLTIAKWLTPDGTWIHQEGIKPDVIVEPHPLSHALVLNNEEVYQKGQQGEFVDTIILMLNTLGYSVGDATIFNETVEAQVKAFQKDHELAETGIVTGETTDILMEETRDYLQHHDVQYQKALEVLKVTQSE